MPPKSNDSDIEKLIELVKVHPAIYDCTREDHMDSLKIDNIWRSIGKQMAKPGMSGADWKKKWKNVVDANRKYTKKIRQKKSGEAAKPVRAYKFAGILSFLESYRNEDSTESNVMPLSGEENDTESWKDSMERSTLSGDDEFNDMGMDNESVISMSSSRSEQRRENDLKEKNQPLAGVSSMSSSRSSRRENYPSDESQPLATDSADHSQSLSTEKVSEETSRKKKKAVHRGRHSLTPDNDSSLENALTSFISAATQSRQQVKDIAADSAEDLLFSNYAIRLKQLPTTLQHYVKLQISQIFFNAKNPDSSIPITPLPLRPQPMVPYPSSSQSHAIQNSVWPAPQRSLQSCTSGQNSSYRSDDPLPDMSMPPPSQNSGFHPQVDNTSQEVGTAAPMDIVRSAFRIAYVDNDN